MKHEAIGLLGDLKFNEDTLSMYKEAISYLWNKFFKFWKAIFIFIKNIFKRIYRVIIALIDLLLTPSREQVLIEEERNKVYLYSQRIF